MNKRRALAAPTPAPRDGQLEHSADSLRKKAEELASSGRCDEAVRIYGELEKSFPGVRLSPQDRLPYVRCLRLTGRTTRALDQLEILKRDKSVTNRLIEEESRQLLQAPTQSHAPATPAPKAPAESPAAAAPAEPQMAVPAPARAKKAKRAADVEATEAH
jgi:hypothetical protein